MHSFVFTGIAGAEDWPMFHHDLERSSETSDVIENPEKLGLKWKFETGYGDFGVSSSPAISENYVYVGSGDDYVYCLDKNTGELIWNFKTRKAVDSSPAILRQPR
jgi:outer membrane protein assembly factor BamB